MTAKTTTTQPLIPPALATELTLSVPDFAPLITDWHAALDRRVAAGELAPATRSAYTISAAKFFAWAEVQPITAVTRRRKRAALTDREVVRVLCQPDADTSQGIRDKAILALMAYTAARTIEMHRADLPDLKSEAGQMVLCVQGKGRDEKDELIVIDNPAAAGALPDWLSVRCAI
jgi:integrase/recombinase XerD